MDVLVAGGTGEVGAATAAELTRRGHTVHVLSRRAGEGRRQGDLLTGEGVLAALRGVDTVVHAAAPRGARLATATLQGTRTLLEAARDAGRPHVVLISIVGIDRVPPAFVYYRAKLEEERLLAAMGLPHSIVRATQFHSFLAKIFGAGAGFAPYLTGVALQPVDAREVGPHLADAVEAGPSGRRPDVAGPKVEQMGDLARQWLRASGLRRPRLRIRIPGAFGAALREGRLTDPTRAVGTTTFADWAARAVSVTR
jgi:uncharacterized protein YbjT (DUF2867 family)